MSNDTQIKQVLALLKRGDGITPRLALDNFGCFRLAAVICRLRTGTYDGTRYPVKTTIINGHDRHRKPVRFARYTLPKPEYDKRQAMANPVPAIFDTPKKGTYSR